MCVPKIFENFKEFVPGWDNKNTEEDLIGAVDEYEEQQKTENTENRVANVKNSQL